MAIDPKYEEWITLWAAEFEPKIQAIRELQRQASTREARFEAAIGIICNLYSGLLPEQNAFARNLQKDLARLFRRTDLSDTTLVVLESSPLSEFLIRLVTDDLHDDTPRRLAPQALSATDQTRAAMLQLAFETEYEDTALTAFNKAFAYYDRTYHTRNYGRVIAILQSSACGKSRLVAELAKINPTFSICFRESPLASTGWPPGDMAVWEYFHSPKSNDFQGEELAASFLGALFQKLEAGLDNHDESQPLFDKWKYGIPNSPQAFARNKFFESVVTEAYAILKDNREWLYSQRQWIRDLESRLAVQASTDNILPPSVSDNSSQSAPVLSPKSTALKSAPTWHDKLFEQLCKLPFESFIRKVKALRPYSHFFLALDECIGLGTVPDMDRTPKKQMTLIAMQRILKAVDGSKEAGYCWFLLLDTNSSVGMLLPSGPQAPSSRLVSEYQPLPPFMYLGFNQFECKMTRVQASDSLALKNLACTGRPYWHTLGVTQLIQSAQQKLFVNVGSSISQTFLPRKKAHVFAAFAVRVCLELSNNESSRNLEAEAVSHHMRILTDVKDNILETAVYSEPILAIAAAVALNHGTNYKEALATLTRQLVVDKAILNRGAQGELISRIILLLARDRATFERHQEYNNTDSIHPVELVTFLKTLLGPDLGDPNSKPVRKVLKFARGKWVNFTHFVVITHDLSELPIEALEKAWFFGAAFQCSHGQEVIDGAFVYYAGPLQEAFDRSLLRLFCWQTKFRSQSASSQLGKGLTSPPIFFPAHSTVKAKWCKPRTIVLLMDLGTSAAFQGTRRKSQVSYRVATTSNSWTGYANPSRGEVEPKNFFLNIRGLSSSEYPVLMGFEDSFEALFAAGHDPLPQDMYDLQVEAHKQGAFWDWGNAEVKAQASSGNTSVQTQDAMDES